MYMYTRDWFSYNCHLLFHSTLWERMSLVSLFLFRRHMSFLYGHRGGDLSVSLVSGSIYARGRSVGRKRTQQSR